MNKISAFSFIYTFVALTFAFFQVPSALAQQNDEPDLAREARLHQIYKSYNENPTPADRWQTAISAATAQTYKVQQGDTLWSVSETLFGDTQFWPKVWSINNSNIENPHLILPLQLVQFSPGTLGEAPSLTIGEAPSADGTGEGSVPTDLKKILGGAPIPESKVKSRPLSGLPDSLPNWKFKEDQRQVINLELSPINRNFGSPQQSLSYYVTEDDVQEMGTITETELAMGSASDYQYIFVRMPNNASGNYLVIRQVDVVKDPFTGHKGNLVQIQGEIQILESVNADSGIYRAIVTKTMGLVEVGAKIVAGEIPSYNSKDEGNPSSANVRIVGGAFASNRRLFGIENLVIFNGGSSQGISSGQTLSIYKQQPARNRASKAEQNARLIGKAKVIKVSEGFATAVVVQASDDIQIGDSTAANLR